MVKPKIERIFLDMDGVIADFNKKYKEMFGIEPSVAEKHKKFEPFFNEFIDKQAFANLELMPDAINLINYLRNTGIPIEILSSTASERRDAQIRPQKMKWLKDHHIEFPVILVPGARLKQQYATPNSILIDDTPRNIDEWRSAGGIGILYTDYISCVATMQMYV
jgi:beta-phosphoglucomutase-like phosphatase (HAD superfamily)